MAMKHIIVAPLWVVTHATFAPYSHTYTVEVSDAAPTIAADMVHSDYTESHGVIGMATNGVLFVAQHYDFTLSVPRPRAMERQFDNCGGHGDDQGHYHYHFAPTCLLKSLGSPVPESTVWWHGNATASHWPRRGSSVRVGTALDGAAIYGPYNPIDGTLSESNAIYPGGPLDECHGMRTGDGEYAYFVTANAPFLPPCLKGRPGVLTGYDSKGAPCPSTSSAEPVAGCPDHKWFQGTTTDRTRRLQGSGEITMAGYLADDLALLPALPIPLPFTLHCYQTYSPFPDSPMISSFQACFPHCPVCKDPRQPCPAPNHPSWP